MITPHKTLSPMKRNSLCSLVAERQSCKLKVLGSIPSGGFFDLRSMTLTIWCMAFGIWMATDSLAEWSKALASGASPQGRGFEPHSCQPSGCQSSGGVPAHFGKDDAPLPDVPVRPPHLPPPALSRRRCSSQPRAPCADLAAARAWADAAQHENTTCPAPLV